MERACVSLALCAVLLALSSPCHASESAERRLRPGFVGGTPRSEIARVFLPGVGLTAVSFLIPQDRTPRANTPHPFDHTAARQSDIAAMGGLAVSLGLGGLLEANYLGYPEREWLYTPMIAAESALYAFAASSALKRLVGRCRPAVYDRVQGCTTNAAPPGSNFRGDEALRSWPSAHTMPIAAMAGAFAGTFVKGLFYAEPARERLIAALVALSFSAATMHYRVAAGAHSENDVWSAFGMGSGIGLVLAWVHPMVNAEAGLASPLTAWQIVPSRDGVQLVGFF